MQHKMVYSKINGQVLRLAECVKVLSVRLVQLPGVGHVQLLAPLASTQQRGIHTSTPLQRKKRKQSKYVPKVAPLHYYGATHRLLRGASVTGERYGPMFDKPDYTFLDGRPTPLTPEQMEQKIERRDQAERVMQYLQDIDNIKNFNELKQKEIEARKEALSNQRLKAKS